MKIKIHFQEKSHLEGFLGAIEHFCLPLKNLKVNAEESTLQFEDEDEDLGAEDEWSFQAPEID